MHADPTNSRNHDHGWTPTTDDETPDPQALWRAYLGGRITRAQLLKAALVGGAAAMAPGFAAAQSGPADEPGMSFPFFPRVEGRYTPESIEEIVSNMITQEYLHMNVGVGVLQNPQLAATVGVTPGPGLVYFQSLILVHQYQIDFWTSIVPSAKPYTTTFTLDPVFLASGVNLLAAGEVVDTLRTATDITAVREFAELGQPTLAKYAAQTTGVTAEMRVTVRWLPVFAGATSTIPPNNKAFETDLLLYTRDAIPVLKALGLIGGTGVQFSYPGRDAVLAASGPMRDKVIQAVPNNAASTVVVTGPGSITGERT